MGLTLPMSTVLRDVYVEFSMSPTPMDNLAYILHGSDMCLDMSHSYSNPSMEKNYAN
jgi:hypothetical protein